MRLPTRKIGNAQVSAIGYGAMGIAGVYDVPEPDETRLKFLDDLHASGCNFWDTADIYGDGDSEELIGKCIIYAVLKVGQFKKTGKRGDIFLATKFGVVRSDPERPHGVNGTPAYVKSAIQKSLARLGVDYVDLYYLHRPDIKVPIEDTVSAMAELVRDGKVKYLGLSEVSATTLRRAHAIHPIAAVQVEYSPFTLDIEDPAINVLNTARELGITIVAYSPLGRGLLTGHFGPDDFSPTDFRRRIPRYSAENFPNLLTLSDGLAALGARHGASAGQVALAWLLAQGDDVIPIPGTRRTPRLAENLGALDVRLSAEEVAEVREIARRADVTGLRYPPWYLEMLYAETPERK